MSPETLFRLINELISAIASLLWPLVTLTLVLTFRKDITAIFARLRKGKVLGQELELEPTVQKFRLSVQEAERELSPIPPGAPSAQPASQTDDDIVRILDDLASNPNVALIRLSSLLEKELRILFGTMGHFSSFEHLSAPKALEWLTEQGLFPKHTIGSLHIFWNLRNAIVHGSNPPNQYEVVKVVDIGLALLRTLRAVPHEVHTIHHPGVVVYHDNQCTRKMDGVYGLVLDTTSPGGGITSVRVFPTTRLSYYKRGKQVTAEWDPTKSWGEAWYVDPDTNEAKIAWSQAAGEFIGRHTDEI